MVDTWTFLFSQCLVATCWPPLLLLLLLLRWPFAVVRHPQWSKPAVHITGYMFSSSFFLFFLLVFQFDFVFLPSCWRLVYWITKFLLFLLISNIVKFRKNKSFSFPSTFCPFCSFSDSPPPFYDWLCREFSGKIGEKKYLLLWSWVFGVSLRLFSRWRRKVYQNWEEKKKSVSQIYSKSVDGEK